MDKHHEHVYKQIEAAYYFVVDKLLVRQDALFKTYLWSASLALALVMALFKDHAVSRFQFVWMPAAVASLVLAFAVIVLCLYSLRGKPDQSVGFPDFSIYLTYFESYDPDKTIQTLASDWMDAFNHQRTEQSLRARRLRASSRLLVLTFVFLAVAVLAAIL